MTEASREHTSDEFGRAPSSQIVNLSTIPRMSEAPTQIIIDGMVERESGVTPSPPAVSMTTIVIVLVAMVVIGVAIVLGFVLLTGHMPVPGAI